MLGQDNRIIKTTVSNSSTFINLHITASRSLNIYYKSYWPRGGIFYISLYFYPIRSHALESKLISSSEWGENGCAFFIYLYLRCGQYNWPCTGSDKWDLACTIFPTGDMINTYCASWWMLFIICGKDNILVFIFSIRLMCGDKTLHLVCCLGSESQPISLSCWMNELRMETSGCASSASLGLFLFKPFVSYW